MSNGLPGAFSSSTQLLPGFTRLTERTQPQMTRPLRSAPIAGASPLLRAGPPARPATVLSPLRLLPLGTLPVATLAGRGVGAHLPTFRAKAADQAHVASMPDPTWPRSGHPPGCSRVAQDLPGFDAALS